MRRDWWSGLFLVDRTRIELVIPGVDSGVVASTTIGPRSPDEKNAEQTKTPHR